MNDRPLLKNLFKAFAGLFSVCVLLLFPISFSVFGQESKQDSWSDIVETTAGNGYYKKVMNLALEFNYIRFEPARQKKNSRVLVAITPFKTSDWYFKTLAAVFNPEISLVEYKLNYRLNDERFADKTAWDKGRLKQYIDQGNRINAWPPIFSEVAEIKKELDRNTPDKYEQKYLLLTGAQTRILIHSELISEFSRVIIVSPPDFPDSMSGDAWKNSQILWVGSFLEKGKLENLQARFGGKILTYEQAFTGQNLLMTNQKVLGDIFAWLNG